MNNHFSHFQFSFHLKEFSIIFLIPTIHFNSFLFLFQNFILVLFNPMQYSKFQLHYQLNCFYNKTIEFHSLVQNEYNFVLYLIIFAIFKNLSYHYHITQTYDIILSFLKMNHHIEEWIELRNLNIYMHFLG
jgi:hypothetical protein